MKNLQKFSSRLPSALPSCTSRYVCLAFWGACSALAACGAPLSDSEKERRQELAFNLEGTYAEVVKEGDKSPSNQVEKVPSGSASPSQLVISNEISHHDVVMTISLNGALSRDDFGATRSELMGDMGLDSAKAEAAIQSIVDNFKTIELGKGRQFGHRGGENIVLDAKGDRSEGVVYSEAKRVFEWQQSESIKKELVVRAYFYFTAYRDNDLIDFSVTRETDAEGQRSFDGKGLWLELRVNEIHDGLSGSKIENKHLDDRPLNLKPFAKVG